MPLRSGPRSSFSICFAMFSSSVSGSSRRPMTSRAGRSSPATENATRACASAVSLPRSRVRLLDLDFERLLTFAFVAAFAGYDKVLVARVFGAAPTGVANSSTARTTSRRFIVDLAA
jgi:hypothetical protein